MVTTSGRTTELLLDAFRQPRECSRRGRIGNVPIAGAGVSRRCVLRPGKRRRPGARPLFPLPLAAGEVSAADGTEKVPTPGWPSALLRSVRSTLATSNVSRIGPRAGTNGPETAARVNVFTGYCVLGNLGPCMTEFDYSRASHSDAAIIPGSCVAVSVVRGSRFFVMRWPVRHE